VEGFIHIYRLYKFDTHSIEFSSNLYGKFNCFAQKQRKSTIMYIDYCYLGISYRTLTAVFCVLLVLHQTAVLYWLISGLRQV
jgi:hypothetical protein